MLNQKQSNQVEAWYKSTTARVHKNVLVTIVILIALVICNAFLYVKIGHQENEIKDIKNEVALSRSANEEVLNMLTDMRDRQQKIEEAEQKRIEQEKEDKRLNQESIMKLKYVGYSRYTDIGEKTNLTSKDMDRIINYYDSMIKGGTRFKGKGKAFIEASKITGLNPIYLFAHAATESCYGNSNIARSRNNYFGINAVDSNPGRASNMGNSVDEGIISGAIWIKKNFYENGYTTLDQMQKAGYASNKDWARTITSIANTAIEVL